MEKQPSLGRKNIKLVRIETVTTIIHLHFCTINKWSEAGTTIPNKTLSDAARSNISRALCQEIQVYKKILRLAVNIDLDDEGVSLDELSGAVWYLSEEKQRDSELHSSDKIEAALPLVFLSHVAIEETTPFGTILMI